MNLLVAAMAPHKQVQSLQKLTEAIIARKLELYHIEHPDSCSHCWKYAAFNAPPDASCKKLSVKCDKILSYLTWSNKLECMKHIAAGQDNWDDTSVCFAALRLANDFTFTDRKFLYSNKGRQMLKMFGKEISFYEPDCDDDANTKLPVFPLAIRHMINLTAIDLCHLNLTESNMAAIGEHCIHLKCIMDINLLKCDEDVLSSLLIVKQQNSNEIVRRNVCQTLQEVYMTDEEISCEKVWCELAEKVRILMLHCHNLIVINCGVHTAQILKYVNNMYRSDCSKIRLILDIRTTSEDIVIFSNMFPKLLHLHIEDPKPKVLQNHLNKFKHLKKLCVKKGNSDDLLQFFKLHGTNLTEMCLRDFTDINLFELATYCPNLEKLVLDSDFYICKQMCFEFRELRSLGIFGSWSCVDGNVVNLIRSAPNIKSLKLCDAATITEDGYSLLFDTKQFVNLNDLELRKAHNLTLYGVRKVIDGCPELRHLTVSKLKQKISVQELSKFQLELFDENIDVKVQIEESIVNQVSE